MLVNQSGHWVQGTGPHSPRPVLRWIVQNFACVTNYPHHASIFDLLIILTFLSVCLIRMLLILAGHECDLPHWWGFVLLGFVLYWLCVLNSQRENWGESPEEHPYAASMYHVTCVYSVSLDPLLGMNISLFPRPWALFSLRHILYQLPLIYVLRKVAVFQLTSQARAKDQTANTAKHHEVRAERRTLVFSDMALGWLSKSRMSLSNLWWTW